MLKMKICALLLSSLAVSAIIPVRASASFGSGAAVIAENLCLIKSGVCGEKICFRDTDFKAVFGIYNFSEITLKSMPDESTGVLIYAGRRAAIGQSIRRRNIPSLVFIPASEKVMEARFSFSAKGLADGREVECILKFSRSANKAPTITSPASNVLIPAKSGACYGTLAAEDPEGDSFEFFVAAYPKYGVLELSKNGDFLYTPPASRRKSDSFSYVVRDAFGNWSKPLRMEISFE